MTEIQSSAIDAGSDPPDHAINLLDKTQPEESSSRKHSPARKIDTGGSLAAKASVRAAVKQEYTRRKFAKYQEARYTDELGSEDSHAGGSSDAPAPRSSARRRDRLRDRISFRRSREILKKRGQAYEVEILYENQRGWFVFGIPLYSSNSLLNFDPPAWTTVDGQDSAVNITNAQVPDPSWTWEWKSWYVDMSHDVDELGWEYSFSFNKKFSWHGTHKWPYSFVRRRRWLRKRVKIRPPVTTGNGDHARQSHILNPDYFTIHSARRDRSPGSLTEPATLTGSTYLSVTSAHHESDYEDEEITNVATLIKHLKHLSVDRKKIESVKNFLEHGDDHIHYLATEIDEIMSLFLYPTSRRQLVSTLQNEAGSTGRWTDDKELDEQATGDKERRSRSLLKAVKVAERYLASSEYGSHSRSNEEYAIVAQDEKELFEDLDNEKIALHDVRDSVESGREIKGLPEGFEHESSVLDQIPTTEES